MSDMRYALQRDLFLPDGTGGIFSGPGITKKIWTAEDPVRETKDRPDQDLPAWVAKWKVASKTAIPTGVYKLAWTRSTRFSKLRGVDVFTLQLLDVPGFGGIRIHSGNDAADTEGCLLPGLARALKTYKVEQSRLSLPLIEDPIRRALERGITCLLEVKGLPA